VENIKFAYVFYEDGLVANVMYTVDNPRKGLLDLSFQREWACLLSWKRKISSLQVRNPSLPEPFAGLFL
jgi:hypothetical protein